MWRRENPPIEGRPYTFVDTRVRGHIIGAILQAQGSQPGTIPEFFEGGDETAELDVMDGDNRVMFKLIAKNEKSTAINLDLYRIIFERIESLDA